MTWPSSAGLLTRRSGHSASGWTALVADEEGSREHASAGLLVDPCISCNEPHASAAIARRNAVRRRIACLRPRSLVRSVVGMRTVSVARLHRPSSRNPTLERAGMGFKGTIAIVAGASRGMGRTFSARLAERGAKVALVARTQADLDRTERELRADGAQIASFPTHITTALRSRPWSRRSAIASVASTSSSTVPSGARPAASSRPTKRAGTAPSTHA